jgi:MFS family permease
MNDTEQVIAEYRGLLTKTEQESQAEFDKTVLALSGGALGLSFAFLTDIVGPERMVHSGYLLWSWIFWGSSSAAVLLSFFTSQLAIRKAINQLDNKKIGMERPGGICDALTAGLNLSGLVCFLLGLLMMIIFLNYNLKDQMREGSDESSQSQSDKAAVKDSSKQQP